jgi:hypothetical protein
MPLLAAALLFVVVLLAAIALMPLSLVLRYRRGTVRRRARGWVAGINVAGLVVSVALFLLVAAATTFWVRDALPYALAGLTLGSVLGALGLWLTRWEPASGSLYYTPNRLLVLTITLVVTARLSYGFWRGWHAWRARVDGTTWIADAGAAGAMAAGAVVLGYYLIYWLGVRRRISRHATQLSHTRGRR